MDRDFYSFVAARDVPTELSVRIACVDGPLPSHSPADMVAEPMYQFRGVNQPLGPPLCLRCELYANNKPLALPVYTSLSSPGSRHSWNEWLHFPYPIADVPLDAQLVFTLLDIAGPFQEVVLGGTTMPLFGKRGTLRRGQQHLGLWRGQAGDPHSPTSTPHRHDTTSEAARLDKCVKRHQRGTIPADPWLDALTFHRIDEIREAHVAASQDLVLTIEMPAWDQPVVFGDVEPVLSPWRPASHGAVRMPANDTPTSSQGQGSLLAQTPWITPSLFMVTDPEAESENIVEAKHRRLVRSQRLPDSDRERKPTAAVRDQLQSLLASPPTRVLTSEEMDLIWSFRYYLTRFSAGLTKFVKSVVWSDAQEAQQATEDLLPMWAEPQLSDALELLGPTFRHLAVRTYAVRQLHKASDAELMLYLLQLVQALKFDETAWRTADATQKDMYTKASSLEAPLRLIDWLCLRGARHVELGTRLYWYITAEQSDARHGELYQRIADTLWGVFSSENLELVSMLERQRHFVDVLSTRSAEIRRSRDARPKKIERLHAWLMDKKTGLRVLQPPLALPLDPLVHITGIVPENSTVFKSNLFPLRLECRTTNEDASPYTMIVKNGDDLRQDQLVIQLFALMDQLLRAENLDLKITPYHVLATGPQDGMVQYVPSMSVAAVVAQHGDLLSYLRAHHPDPANAATFHVQASVLDTFVRSCAGYCVITYLLGVGDRHLDNLLLAPDGRFFHVDFGYILGRDPKPFPPPVKICKEMVDAMGGPSSMYYMRFKKLCHTAFACLRKNANLILNLVSLMVEADIPDIRAEPDKAVVKIQEKFMLDVNEEQAATRFEGLLNDTSYISSMFDRLHNMAQYFRP